MSDTRRETPQRFRDRAAYPVVYMFAVTFFFAAVLIGVGSATRGRVEANRRFLFERAVLAAVGTPPETLASPVEVHRLFGRTMLPPSSSSGGAWRYMPGDVLEAYALPIEGQGFWDTIRGVVGIAPDGRTLTGIAFSHQNETPGLGAEITKPAFRGQFEGVRLSDGPMPISFYRADQRDARGQLDAVTGATQTCTRLENIINSALVTWRGRTGADPRHGGEQGVDAASPGGRKEPRTEGEQALASRGRDRGLV